MPKRQSSSSSSSSQQQSSEQEAPKFVTVHVSKLTPNVSDKHLLEIFSHFGNVKGVTLTKGPKLTSTAVLQFEKKQQADTAIANMNKGYIDGTKISVQYEAQVVKVQKTVQKTKPIQKSNKRRQLQRNYKKSKSRSRQNYRNRQRQGRNRRQKYQDRRGSSGSSSSDVSNSNSSSESESSRS